MIRPARPMLAEVPLADLSLSKGFYLAVLAGLREHFPELTEEARLVIAGSYSYSHAK